MVAVHDLMKKIVSRARIMSETSLKRKIEEDPLQTHSSDGRPKTKKMLLTEKMDAYDSEYYFENGLRKVYPYQFIYHSYARGRWIGRKIIEIYRKEFRAINPSRLEKRFIEGQIRVNDCIIAPDYIIRNNDIITSKTHRHELPVIGLPIKIVHEDEGMLVVDKPPSIPIHSCGRFHFNSLLQILRKDNNYDKLFPCHRLDRLTSGMVLLAKNPAQARQIIDDISNRLVEKEYVCKVEGEFPEGEIICDQPIFSLYPKIGLQIIHASGKASLTIFERLSTDGKTSIVKCKPKTGRTHQIRVHLQYLGYPIVDDYLYNSFDFGPKKGKDAEYGVSNLEELIEKVTNSHPVTHYLRDESIGALPSEQVELDGKNKEDIEKLSNLINKHVSNEWKEHMNNLSYDSKKLTHDTDCEECLQNNRDPISSELFIHLHCRRYKTSIWDFETELPFWAC